jgi:ubiquinone/menaquinone biosynthesis C-methylase UbiE
MSIGTFYDNFSARQSRVGINERHRAIQEWLVRFGLAPGMDVLEVGCGVGTQTALISACLKGEGRLVAVDLSPRSVDLARERLAGRRNVEFVVADVVDLEIDRAFDVIVLPDVLEHVPLERHPRLFANIRRWLKEDGWVLIHMPNPFFLEWCHQHRPDLLQIVDQPIFTQALQASIQPSGLYIHYLKTYSIWVPECDYQVVVLKPLPARGFTMVEATPSGSRRIVAAVRRVLGIGTHREPGSGHGGP